jgi:hypothetical protein
MKMSLRQCCESVPQRWTNFWIVLEVTGEEANRGYGCAVALRRTLASRKHLTTF